MVLQMAVFHSFLWLSNIPCVCVCVCVCVCLISSIFFILSAVNGHLDCFHVLAIVNSAAVDISLQVSFQIMGFFF